jgi:hypothetical protein
LLADGIISEIKPPITDDAALDQRVWLIYVASIGLHPVGKTHPFEDFKSEMGITELEAFLPGVRSRWGRLLGAEKNLTSEPNRGFSASEAAAHKEIAALHDVANDGINVLSKMRDLGIGTSATPVGRGGQGLDAIEASVSARGPLLRPIS